MGQAEEGVTLGVRGPAGCLGIYRMMVVLYHLINKTMQKVKKKKKKKDSVIK